MKWLVCLAFLGIGCSQTKSSFLQAVEVQLSNPQITVDSTLFRNSAQLDFDFDLEDAEIYYHLNDGEEKRYSRPVTIQNTTHLRAQSRKKGHIPGDWIEQTLIKVNRKTDDTEIRIEPQASEQYPGEGAHSLIDLKTGTLSFKSNKAWLGFQSPELVIQLDFRTPILARKIYLSLLDDDKSWIFLPKKIEVSSNGEIVGEMDLDQPLKAENSSLKMIPVSIYEQTYNHLEIKIINHNSIPEWHVGKGTAPWLFIDELFIQ